MKKGIHPNYHEITVIFTNGEEMTLHSTWGKPGDKMRLDVDPFSQQAWTGVHRLGGRGGQLSKFKKRFGGFELLEEK